jgi:hypothetical protein
MSKQTLYVLVSREQIGGPSEQSLARAAHGAGLGYTLLTIEDIALDDVPNMPFQSDDLLYRISIDPKASAIESGLSILHGDNLTTIYHPKPQRGPTRRYHEMFELMAAQVPIIPTKLVDDTWVSLSDEVLTEKVHQLSGFPVLFKTLGLSHGAGVQKLDSLAGLRSAIALAIEQRTQAILREYLPDYRHYRVIIVANQPVAAIEYHKPADDFRTNAAEIPEVTAVEITTLDPAIIDMAIQSVAITGSIIGGVDVLVDTTKNIPYMAEANVPCNFSRAEGPTGIDIGCHIVRALMDKAKTTNKQ